MLCLLRCLDGTTPDGKDSRDDAADYYTVMDGDAQSATSAMGAEEDSWHGNSDYAPAPAPYGGSTYAESVSYGRPYYSSGARAQHHGLACVLLLISALFLVAVLEMM